MGILSRGAVFLKFSGFGPCNASLNSTPIMRKIIPKGQFAGQTFNGLKVGSVFTWREGCSSLPQRAAFSSEAFSRLIQKYRRVGVDFTTSGRGRVGGCVPKRDVPLLTKKWRRQGCSSSWVQQLNATKLSSEGSGTESMECRIKAEGKSL